jgi:DnaJ-class molecular chaperone
MKLECATCEGKGTVPDYEKYWNNAGPFPHRNCPDCRGKGSIKIPNERFACDPQRCATAILAAIVIGITAIVFALIAIL